MRHTTAKQPQAKKAPPVDTDGYAVGSKVVHPIFGDGTVTAVDANKLTIRFRGGRERQILDAFVKHRPR